MIVKKIVFFLGTALILSGCYQKTADIRQPLQQLANSVQQLNQKVDDLSNRVETVENTNTNSTANQNQVPADWKTYTNNEFGFSIQYPTEWKLTVNQYLGNDVITLSHPVLSTGLSILPGGVEAGELNPAVSTVKNITINGVDFRELSWPEGQREISVLDKTLGLPITFRVTVYANGESALVDSILSTLRFVKKITAAKECSDIVNETFSSVREYGCGMVPAGQPPTPCHYELKFFSDRYEWGHDDTIDLGSYTCANNAIKASTSYPYGDINATYDPATKILKWKDGEEYRRL